MGYDTTFYGRIKVVPDFNSKEIEYLNKFSDTRRMNRTNGDYYVDGKGLAGQDYEPDIIDYNSPPLEQPGLWCQWIPIENNYIGWNGTEKFYYSPEWMWYLIQNFIKPEPVAKLRFPDKFSFLIGHTCSGKIKAQGEDPSDRWNLVVKNNEVYQDGTIIKNEGLRMVYCKLRHNDCSACDDRFLCWTANRPKGNFWGNPW